MNKKENRKAIISINPEDLFNLLGLHENFSFHGAEYNFLSQTFNILIGNDTFPKVSNNTLYPKPILNYDLVTKNNKSYLKLISFELNGKEYKLND